MLIKQRTSINHDLWLFIASIIVLLLYGLIFIYSASSIYALERLGSAHYYVQKHLLGLALGVSGCMVAYQLPIAFVKRCVPWAFLASLLLTFMTKLPKIGVTIHGSSRWLKLIGFSFQPSELLKYAFVLYIAYYFSKKQTARTVPLAVYLRFLCILGITSIALLLQPDFGTAVTLCITGILLAFIAEVDITHLGYTLASGLPLLLFLIYLKPYRMKRVLTFLDPWSDPQGAGFQIIQSFIAIGSGNYAGIGIGKSKQKFFYLPMQHTDFIFSIIAEEIGFLGAMVIVLFFVMLLYTSLRMAMTKKDLFARYAICGFALFLSLQAFINIAVATGLVPTKGIGLPFISYGNSSLVSTLTMLGIIVRLITTAP